MNLVKSTDYIVGFRPEHFLLKAVYESKGNLLSFPFQVTRLEYLGADRLLYGALGSLFKDQKVIAKLPSTVPVPIQPGESYEFVVKEEDLKFFDSATGLRSTQRPSFR